MTVLRRATESSAVVRRLAPIAGWLRQTRQRIGVGLGEPWSDRQERREVERVRGLVSTSRIAAVVSSVVMAPVIASREAAVRRMLEPLHTLALPDRIRTASVAIIVAVLTHTALLAVLGVPVQVLGWSTRVVLVAAGASGVCWPEVFAAAWKDRQTRSRR